METPLEHILTVCESQQRIFLMILQRMQMNRNEEKKLFDICISITNDYYKNRERR